MSDITTGAGVHALAPSRAAAWQRFTTIGTLSFLTLVDLFATQAILPALAQFYRVSPAAMGLAVNASTLGMAVAGLSVALIGSRVPRRAGIVWSLCLLAVPTALLASAHTLTEFALLRIAQGVCMCSAFSLTLAYLGEACSVAESAGAFAAYIAGNVASNLIGRMMAAGLTVHLGLAGNFYAFAALNLLGAAIAGVTVGAVPRIAGATGSAWRDVGAHLRNGALAPAFGIGFCILFAFIGTFTYVNFVLVRPPLRLGMMAVGFSYLAFLPSVLTTALAGRVVRLAGARRALLGSLAAAGAGLALLLTPLLSLVVCGMVLVGCGTFFAQAVATGYVGRTATVARGAASGLYLACYFAGGLVGSFVLGQVFDRAGWTACVAAIGAALAVAALLTLSIVSHKEGEMHHANHG